MFTFEYDFALSLLDIMVLSVYYVLKFWSQFLDPVKIIIESKWCQKHGEDTSSDLSAVKLEHDNIKNL